MMAHPPKQCQAAAEALHFHGLASSRQLDLQELQGVAEETSRPDTLETAFALEAILAILSSSAGIVKQSDDVVDLGDQGGGGVCRSCFDDLSVAPSLRHRAMGDARRSSCGAGEATH